MFCLSKHKIDIKNCSICGSSASSSSLTLENQNKQEKQSFKFNKSKFDFDFFNRDEMGRIIPIKKFFIQKKDQQQPASFIFNDKQENDTDLIIFASNESNSREQDMPFLCSKCCNESMITPIKPINDFNRKFNCIYNYSRDLYVIIKKNKLFQFKIMFNFFIYFYNKASMN